LEPPQVVYEARVKLSLDHRHERLRLHAAGWRREEEARCQPGGSDVWEIKLDMSSPMI